MEEREKKRIERENREKEKGDGERKIDRYI